MWTQLYPSWNPSAARAASQPAGGDDADPFIASDPSAEELATLAVTLGRATV
jgi:hypothetical protein